MKEFRVLLIFSIFVFSNMILAEIPNTVAYRGQLTDETGNALDATVDITFNIFDVASGGTSLWSETQSVSVTDGYFDIELGSVTALDLNFDSQYWVELTIDGETLSPRDKLTPTAFSIRANIANKADSSLYTVSSSADHSGRIGHVRFIPGDGGSITEAAASSETDTIYIAIGGGTTASTGTSYPMANKWFGNRGTQGSGDINEIIYTVPENRVFYIYESTLHISVYYTSYSSYYDSYFTINHEGSENIFSTASAASNTTSNSSPVVVHYDPPIRLEAGDILTYYLDHQSYYSGCLWGYAIVGWEGTE